MGFTMNTHFQMKYRKKNLFFARYLGISGMSYITISVCTLHLSAGADSFKYLLQHLHLSSDRTAGDGCLRDCTFFVKRQPSQLTSISLRSDEYFLRLNVCTKVERSWVYCASKMKTQKSQDFVQTHDIGLLKRNAENGRQEHNSTKSHCWGMRCCSVGLGTLYKLFAREYLRELKPC
jgi:hypothetical protein